MMMGLGWVGLDRMVGCGWLLYNECGSWNEKKRQKMFQAGWKMERWLFASRGDSLGMRLMVNVIQKM